MCTMLAISMMCKEDLSVFFPNFDEQFQTFGSCFLISQFPDIWISEAESERVKEGERDQCPFFVAAVGGVGVLAGAETSGSKKRRGGLT